MISGLWDVSPSPKTNYFYLWGRIPKSIKKIPWNIFENVMFVNLKFWETQHLVNFGKDGRRKNPLVRLINS